LARQVGKTSVRPSSDGAFGALVDPFVRMLADRADVGFACLDLQLRYTYINQWLADINGLAPETHLGRCVCELVPTLHAMVQEVTGQVLRTGQPVLNHPFSGQTVRQPGVTRHWIESWFPLRDTAGTTIGFGVVVEETTASKQAEQQLRLQAELIERISDGIIATDGDFRIKTWNKAAQRIYGYSAREVKGRHADELLRTEFPGTTRQAALAQLLAQGWISIDVVHYDKQGRRLNIQSTTSIKRDDKGNLIETYAVQRDLTQRMRAQEAVRASEQRLRLATEAGGLVPWEINLLSDRVNPSPGLLAAFGLEARDPILAREQWRKLICEEDRQKLYESVEAAKAGRPGHHVEYRFHHPDGTIHWHESHGQVVTDEQGRAIRLVGFLRDITQRKRAEAALAQAKEAADQANQAKDQFIATLSHELRTPLTPVVASLSALVRDPRLPEDLRQDMMLLQRNIGLEVHLINDLLDVTRIVNGKLQLSRQVLDLAQVLRDVSRIVASDLDARSQTLTIETPQAPYWVQGDVARLHQVFWNLVRNAIKFSPDHGRIGVRAAVHDDPCDPSRKALLVSVADQGAGIEAALLPRLFKAFEQGQRGTGQDGLGLGLAICKGIIELHCGSISAASEGPGQGATFTVTLPLEAAPVVPSPAAVGPQHQVQVAALRILLVEDHADTAKIMSRLLCAEGHTVTCVDTVAKALTAVDQAEFDVLMSDLGLPDGSGYDLMRRLVADGRKLRGIAVSGHGSSQDIRKSLDAGFVDHITKPVDFDALHHVLLRIMTGGGVLIY